METEVFPSIFNDVIGPVMRGPSSSHTAASWRIAKTCVDLLNDDLKEALIEFPQTGVWASNYREQGTAMGMDGGLLGIDITDERMINPDLIAKLKGITINYRISSFKTDHPNTIRISLSGKTGGKAVIIAVSTGGGMFEIRKYNAYATNIHGDYYYLFITVKNSFGQKELKAIQSILPVNSTISLSEDGQGKLIMAKSFHPFQRGIAEEIKKYPGVDKIIHIRPVLPVLSGNELNYPFTDIESMLSYARKKKITLGKLGLIYESCRSGLPEDELILKMKEIIQIIEKGISIGLAGTKYGDRILQQQSHLIKNAENEGLIKTGSMVNSIIANITALMESKSAMQVIVAVPTAGSCGAFGGTLKAFCDTNHIEEEYKILAYFAGGLIGVYFAKGPGFSAEEYGCQVETGAAAPMTAAALTELSGGNAEQAVGAASMALQNTIGLVCDPVADRVEVPCLGRNVTAGMNALAASTMALSGFDPVIPLDQVINTVKQVGKTIPIALRNTGRGGLSVTPQAKKLKSMLRSRGEKGA
ncbi:MAG: L-serine ammonia-lyase, iron-sulfur-dependent, subunit alpha [Bacteroidales bacterium]|nr:L-serine ammonia-lyase, iron-sulfur-dependent, subunit alpha [Bacteroidales bacterium]